MSREREKQNEPISSHNASIPVFFQGFVDSLNKTWQHMPQLNPRKTALLLSSGATIGMLIACNVLAGGNSSGICFEPNTATAVAINETQRASTRSTQIEQGTRQPHVLESTLAAQNSTRYPHAPACNLQQLRETELSNQAGS
jgi:hypothetical protein